MQTLLQSDIWLQSYEFETKEFKHCFCQYLKNNIPDIRLIPLDHVTYVIPDWIVNKCIDYNWFMLYSHFLIETLYYLQKDESKSCQMWNIKRVQNVQFIIIH